jgi:hypothetical protein
MFSFFTLVFAIGYPAYNSYVEDGHMQNMEKSFSLLSYDANLVAMQKLTISSTEIKMYGGTLATRDTGALSMNISYYRDEDGTDLIGSSGNFDLSALEYSKGSNKLAYIDGSVCRYGPGGTIMLNEPEITNGTDFLLIPMVNLYQSKVSIAGDTLTRITFMTPYYSKYSQVIGSLGPETVPDVKNVTIRMSGDYAPCFSRYFHEKFGFQASAGANGMINLSKEYPQGINLTLLAIADVSIDVN